MKTMSCNELAGACEIKFTAETFDEIKEMSMKHGMEMFQAGDVGHLEAMNRMREKMKDPSDMAAWIEKKKQEFDELPED